MLLSIFLCCLPITLLLLKWYLHLYKYSVLNVPGPKPLPIIGNVLEFGTSLQDIMENLVKLRNKYGSIFKLYLGPETVALVLTDPKYIQEILSSPIHVNKSDFYNPYIAVMGKGFGLAKRDEWRAARKLINPTFHLSVLEKYNLVFNKATDHLVEQFQKNLDRPIDIASFAQVFSLQIVCATAMGLNFNDDANDPLTFIDSINESFRIAMGRVFSLIEKNDFLFKYTRNYKIQQGFIRKAWNYTETVIKQRMAERSLNKKEKDTSRRMAFIDILLDEYDNNQSITLDYIRDQVTTFMVAGFDTVATTLSFLLLELSFNADVQEKILQEVNSVLENNQDGFITLQEMNRMVYCECVIKETLRKNTTMPFFERVAESEIDLGDGIRIPKGTNINIFAYAMHSCESLYPNPKKFDPDRFLPENSENRKPYSFIPFSAGPRDCVGVRFAMYELKSSLAKIIRNFKIEAIPGFKLELETDILMKSKNGYPIRLVSRK